MLAIMLLIAAALSEELEAALRPCTSRTRIRIAGVRAYRAERNGHALLFAKTGACGARSARRLEKALAVLDPSRVLVVGYAGALDPGLKLGDLVIVRRAAALGDLQPVRLPLDRMPLGRWWELSGGQELLGLSRAAGLAAHCGDLLTSPLVIGEPSQKLLLHRRFQAAAIDMETAALAAVAASRGLPMSCVRAVSDEADDPFLAPFSHAPTATLAGQALRIVAAGHWVRRLQQWRERAGKARRSLEHFLVHYLDTAGAA